MLTLFLGCWYCLPLVKFCQIHIRFFCFSLNSMVGLLTGFFCLLSLVFFFCFIFVIVIEAGSHLKHNDTGVM